MNKEKKVAMLYVGVALLWYVAAFLNYINGDKSQGTVYLCIGSVFLSCSTIYNSKNKKVNEDIMEDTDNIEENN